MRTGATAKPWPAPRSATSPAAQARLLSTAYQRMSLLHELHGGDPGKLHGPMMRHGLVGLDVLNIAVHLTAAMLASSHPDTPFDGECLLAMPYGGQDDESVAVGSMDLLAEHVQRSLMDTAAAVSAGGRAPEEVRDLVSRMGHAKFDLVIMNPPFTRPTNHEAEHADVPIPAYAAFETTPEEQSAMAARVKTLARGIASPRQCWRGVLLRRTRAPQGAGGRVGCNGAATERHER